MPGVIDTLESIVGAKRIKVNEPLAEHTLVHMGISAEMFIEIEAQDILIKLIKEARKLNVPVSILGSGSRTTAQKDIAGLVIKNMCRRFDKVSMKGTIRHNEIGVETVQVYAQAGALMNQLVRFTLDEGLGGLEYQLGLPGTVGGAIYTNAKYKPTYLPVSKALQTVTLLSEAGEVQTYNGEVPYFVFTDEEWQESKDVILSAVFKVTPMDKKVLWARGEEAVQWRNQHGKKAE